MKHKEFPPLQEASMIDFVRAESWEMYIPEHVDQVDHVGISSYCRRSLKIEKLQVLELEAFLFPVTPMGQFPNRFYEHLKALYEFKVLINK